MAPAEGDTVIQDRRYTLMNGGILELQSQFLPE
jgi:hypothetical protein